MLIPLFFQALELHSSDKGPLQALIDLELGTHLPLHHNATRLDQNHHIEFPTLHNKIQFRDVGK